MFFLRRLARSWLSAVQLSPLTLSRTSSRTPSKVCFRASISICLICLLMVVRPSAPLHGHADARGHGAGHRDRLDVVALDAGRLDGLDLVDEGGDVGGQLVVVEAHLADAGV